MLGPATMVLIVSLAFVTAGAQAQNLIKNGSFETPVVAFGGSSNFLVGQRFQNWTVIGEPGRVSIVSGTSTSRGFTFPAKDGAQWLDLTGDSTSQVPVGVKQTVATVPGRSYTLQFSVGNVYDLGDVFGTSSTVHVVIDGVTAMTATNFEHGGVLQVWKSFKYVFSAETEHTDIAFINGDPREDGINGLDAISLVESGTQAAQSRPDAAGD